WDYWCVLGGGHALSVTYSDVSYVGIVSAFVLDLATGDTAQREVIVPLARGIALPERVGGADLSWAGRGLRLDLSEVGDGTRIQVAFTSDDGEEVEADVLVSLPAGHETMSVVVPWSDARFQYTSKHTARPAAGRLRWGARTIELGEHDDAWGVLDAGRGRWPHRTVWNWGAASGRTDERVVGLQLGGRWTDGTGSTENALCLDGRLHKLSEPLVWEYSRADWLRPWVITSPLSDRVELRFEPLRERRSRLELGVAGTEVHQCFGRYHGRVIGDDGDPVRVDGLLGWAEEARMRW
ncbi:MAG: DUF2804 domain-containing protein, partial [Acidimicrobiales bacterium]|nr:DUF2804 domain-containing protein [Acidimicrobiales bacterium]